MKFKKVNKLTNYCIGGILLYALYIAYTHHYLGEEQLVSLLTKSSYSPALIFSTLLTGLKFILYFLQTSVNRVRRKKQRRQLLIVVAILLVIYFLPVLSTYYHQVLRAF